MPNSAKILVIAAAAAVLATCGEGPGEPQPQAGQQEVEAGPRSTGSDHELQPGTGNGSPADGDAGDGAADPDMQWNFGRTAEGPRLTYGVPQTDNVRLLLRCPAGSGPVVLSFIRPQEVAQARPSTVTIASGGEQQSVSIEREQGPLGTTVRAELPVSAAPLRRFRAGESLDVRWGDETIRVPGAAAQADRFFSACG